MACQLSRKGSKSFIQIIDVTREFALNVFMVPREDKIIVRGRERGPRPLLLENVGPRWVTTGDDIVEVSLDLRGVTHEKRCEH